MKLGGKRMPCTKKALLPRAFDKLVDAPDYQDWEKVNSTNTPHTLDGLLNKVDWANKISPVYNHGFQSDRIPILNAIGYRFDELIYSTDSDERDQAVEDWRRAFTIVELKHSLRIHSQRIKLSESKIKMSRQFFTALVDSNTDNYETLRDLLLPQNVPGDSVYESKVYSIKANDIIPIAHYSQKYHICPSYDLNNNLKALSKTIALEEFEEFEEFRELLTTLYPDDSDIETKVAHYLLANPLRAQLVAKGIEKILDNLQNGDLEWLLLNFKADILPALGDSATGSNDKISSPPQGFDNIQDILTDCVYIFNTAGCPPDKKGRNYYVDIRDSSWDNSTGFGMLLPVRREYVKEALKNKWFRDRTDAWDFFMPKARLNKKLDGKLSIEVTLFSNKDENHEFTQEYTSSMLIGLREDGIKALDPPVVAVWPNKADPQKVWNNHYLFQTEAEDTARSLLFTPLDEDGEENTAKDNRHSGEVDDYPYTITQTNGFPVALYCSREMDLGLLILPKDTLPHDRKKHLLVGIDFGTTGTVAFYSEYDPVSMETNLVPKKINFNEFDCLFVLGKKDIAELRATEPFLPIGADKNNHSSSVQTLLRSQPHISDKHALIDTNIFFTERHKTNFSHMEYIHSNLKQFNTTVAQDYLVQEKYLTDLFLTQFIGMALYKALLLKAGQVYFRFSYSSATGMNARSYKEYIDMLVGFTTNEENKPASNIVQFSGFDIKEFPLRTLKDTAVAQESFAAGLFLKSDEAASLYNFSSLDIRAVTIILDIGGGSTDVSIWHAKVGDNAATCLANTSFDHAGQSILIDNIYRLSRQTGDIRNCLTAFLRSFGVTGSFDHYEPLFGEDKPDFRMVMEHLLPNMNTIRAITELDNALDSDNQLSSTLHMLNQLRNIIAINLCTIIFFAAQMINSLIKANMDFQPGQNNWQDVAVIITGNASKLLEWLRPKERGYRPNTPGMQYIKEFLSASFSDKNIRTISIKPSRQPKEAVAAGLVSVADCEESAAGQQVISIDIYGNTPLKDPYKKFKNHNNDAECTPDEYVQIIEKNCEEFREHYLQELFRLFMLAESKTLLEDAYRIETVAEAKPPIANNDRVQKLIKEIDKRIIALDATKKPITMANGINRCLSVLNETAYNKNALEGIYEDAVQEFDK
jgi:hypothetical protein